MELPAVDKDSSPFSRFLFQTEYLVLDHPEA